MAEKAQSCTSFSVKSPKQRRNSPSISPVWQHFNRCCQRPHLEAIGTTEPNAREPLRGSLARLAVVEPLGHTVVSGPERASDACHAVACALIEEVFGPCPVAVWQQRGLHVLLGLN